jgi:hypothetical protein
MLSASLAAYHVVPDWAAGAVYITVIQIVAGYESLTEIGKENYDGELANFPSVSISARLAFWLPALNR